jgi:AraC-like DNA-binding protein
MRQHLDLPPAWDGDLWHYRNLGRTHAMHHHAELEFNLITQGSGAYLLANRRYQIHRGDLLWLFPAQEHVLIDQSVDFEMWIGVCKSRMVRRIAADPGATVLRERDPSGEHCRHLPPQTFARLASLFAEIVASRERTPLFNAGLRYALAAAWTLFESAATIPVHDVHPAVEKAARLIRDEETTAPGLDELASRCGLSASRLSRLFKQQTGVALVDFRNRQRVEKFLVLYGDGRRRTLLDAALEAGFGSYPQFHRVFKRVIGCSPGRYRKQQA